MKKIIQLKKKYDEILKKLKDENIKLDISKDEDLSFAIMNLIAIEEHLFMSGVKTENKKYYELLNEVRNVRKELMKKIVKNVEEGAETWCVSKHLLSATMRLSEVGTKLLNSGDKEEAIDFFNKAYLVYTIFWALNLGMFNLEESKKVIEKDKEIKKEVEESKKIEEKIKILEKNSEKTFSKKLKNLFKKLIDCCIE